LQEYYLGGKGGETDGVVQQLLGRAPIPMDKFLAEFAGEFRSQSASA
jgi:hypothetical protein